MSNFITALTSGDSALTGANLWDQVSYAVPVITGVAMFAFAYYIVRKLIKGASKGKVRM